MRKYLFLLGLFLGAGNLLSAQEIHVLDLKGAINYALEHQADAKKADLQVENSKYIIQDSYAAAYPQISGTGSLMFMPLKMEMMLPASDLMGPDQGPEDGVPPVDTPDGPDAPEYIPLEFGMKWGASVGGMVMQNLFNQAIFTGMKAARTTREFYQINAELTREQVIEKVATAYYNVFVLKEQLQTLDSTYANLEKSSKIIQSLYDNGLVKEIDLDRVKVQLSNLSASRQQLKKGVQLQENALKFYIGMPIHQTIHLVEEDFNVQQYLLEEEIDLEERTELKMMNKRSELLEIQKKSKVAAYYPSLSLFGAYTYSGQGSKFPIGRGMSQGIYWSDFALVGLNLQIPIFSGFKNKAEVGKADIELRTHLEELKNTELALSLEYSNAKAQIENNWISIESQKENVELAQKVVTNTENNYQLGLASLTELLEAQNALVDAKNNYSDAVLQYKLAEIQLLKAKGQLDRLK